MTHRLHIENEGYQQGNYGVSQKKVVRPYCECGWLGKKVAAFDTADQQARQQFYDHLDNHQSEYSKNNETINPPA